jgi:hypothetical protein
VQALEQLLKLAQPLEQELVRVRAQPLEQERVRELVLLLA